jgi:hypothetical protein
VALALTMVEEEGAFRQSPLSAAAAAAAAFLRC